MIAIDRLKSLPLVQALTAAELDEVCRAAEHRVLEVDDVLVREGEVARGFFLHVAGEIILLRADNAIEMPVGRHVAPSFFGEVQVLGGDRVPVTLRAVTRCELLRVPNELFFDLLHRNREFLKLIFRAAEQRARGIESFLRTREKMAALGTLAAGLAHELNNPAAAVIRSSARAKEALNTLGREQRALFDSDPGLDGLCALDGLRAQASATARLTDALELSDREEAFGAWLDAAGVERAWTIAPTLAATDLAIADLEGLRAKLGPALGQGLAWLHTRLEVESLVDEASRGATRIAEIVKAMKSYSYMDQAPQQEVDLHDGLDDTLTILKHKLKRGIEVRREYDRALPRMSAFGSELNQVWTNLIDNAADAMGGNGTLVVRTRREADVAVVEIVDDGPGIPTAVQPRIFEPFFTTKAVGKGTGLGLDIARKIVVNRHRGSIRVASRPGETVFSVRLPLAR
jgi:signal transduction histidine kinase